MASEYKIAATFAGLTSLSTLGITPDPRSTYKPYDSYVESNDFSVKGVGFPSAVWSWDYIHNTQKAILRTYCTDAYSEIYIRTLLNDNSYQTYKAIMVFPLDESVVAKRSMNLTILLNRLIVVTS